MANSADPDQTALFAYAILSETLVYEILGFVPLMEVGVCRVTLLGRFSEQAFFFFFFFKPAFTLLFLVIS